MGKTLSLYEPLTLSLVPVLMNLSPDSIPEDEINLLDLLIIIARNKKMILSVTFVGAVLSVGISLLLPKIYTATTKIIPPQSSQSSSVNSVMLAQLGGLSAADGAAGAALRLKDPMLFISPC